MKCNFDHVNHVANSNEAQIEIKEWKFVVSCVH